MFPYFGRKKRLASKYPAPRFPLVIEPFAGSMAYTLHHRPPGAIGVEKDPRVVDLWERLLDGTYDLTPPVVGEQDTRLFVKLCAFSDHSLTSPSLKVTEAMARNFARAVTAVTEAAEYASTHVAYLEGSWDALPTPAKAATYFIDPPYAKFIGRTPGRGGYLESANDIDYEALAAWCRSLPGQVIVCEQEGADWLPFRPLASNQSIGGNQARRQTEVIWTNSDGT